MGKTIAGAFALATLFLTANAAGAEPSSRDNAFASTYRPVASTPVLIRDATVLTGDGGRIENGDVLMRDGKVVAVGENLEAGDATVIDGTGKWVTPGIIDVHSHLGVYPAPGMTAHADGNEMTAPVTPQVWAEHGVWPQDPGFDAARAGGVTTMLILPGSANLIGGRGTVLRNVPALSVQEMKFPDAPYGLKMACGENPKRVYGTRMQAPMTRMGNVAGYRAAFIEAQKYREAWDAYEASVEQGNRPRKGDRGLEPPVRDLRLDTLAGVLRGEITVQIHCYRADEMALMLDLAKEFDFRIAAFHHGVEAYKLADRLAAEGVCAALWADWWGFKMEAWDGIQENIALVDRPADSCAIVHSDSSEGIQRLNQEAAKAMARGEAIGLHLPPEHAIRWLTSNAARALGIAETTGTLEAGKRADVVLWNRNPFSVYAQAERVWIDGALLYDRNDRSRQPVSDFLLGTGGDAVIGATLQRLAAALALAAALPCAAQDVLIKDATVHTAGAQGSLVEHDVLVQGGVIRAIALDIPAPAGVQVIQARGLQLTPGLFGGLSALGLEEVSGEAATVDENLALGTTVPPGEATFRPEFDVDVAFNPASTAIAVNRVEGVTWTALTPGSLPGGSFVAGQGSAVRLDGGVSLLADSRSLHVSIGGGMSPLSGGSRAGQWMLLEQAIAEARSGIDDGLLTRAGRTTLARYLAGGRVVFHVDRAADIRQVLAFAKRNGLRVVIAGGAEAWMVAADLKAADVPVLVDALANLPGDFDSLHATLENAARLHAAGVRVGFSQTGDATHNARKLRHIAGNAVANGLPWEAGLAGVTSVPADAFGIGARQGRIAVGQVADLVLWNGDPLEVTTLPQQVWFAGVPVSMRSRQTELRDRYFRAPASLPRAYQR